LGAVDAAIAVLVPRIAARFVRAAPRAQLNVSAIDPVRAVELVEAGALDVALTPHLRSSSTVKHRTLFSLELLLAMRKGHPLARRALTREALLRYPRLQVSFGAAPPPPVQLDVRAALSVTSFLAVPHVLTGCDAWAALPGPFAQKLAGDGAFVARPLPG